MNLEISGLEKRYPGGVHALRGVNLSIPRGMFGLLGPNGAGKSSLMRTIATLQPPDEGSIHFGDIDCLNEQHRLRATLGYLPQSFGLYPNARADQLLDHFAVLKGITQRSHRKALVASLLERVNLSDACSRKVGTFSGGMRQRFGIAIALIGNPRLIIVDEPTAGLDPEERVRFLNLLSELGQTAVVLLSTHHVGDVAELCTRIAVLDKGRIVLRGDPDAHIASLAGCIWERAVTPPQLQALREQHEVLSTRLKRGQRLARVCADQAPDTGFASVEPVLEDAYFHALRNAND